jgi:hypothetical protein
MHPWPPVLALAFVWLTSSAPPAASVAWTVEVENAGTRYVFGISVELTPDSRKAASQQPPAYFSRRSVYSTSPAGERAAVSRASFAVRPGGWPAVSDYTRLVLIIDDAWTLRQLFHGRPQTATFVSDDFTWLVTYGWAQTARVQFFKLE